DGKLLATAGADERERAPDQRTLSQTIQLWDTADGKLLHRFGRQTVPPGALAFTPDGEILASTGDAVRLWKVRTGKELALLGALEFRGWASGGPLALSPDGRLLAAPTKGPGIVLYEVASAREAHRLAGHGQAINALAFTPDGRRLVSGSLDTTALV